MFVWNDELENRLREDWAAGIPASLIGERLGTTKGSIIGKAHRLGLAQRRSRSPKSEQVSLKSSIEPREPWSPPKNEVPSAEDIPLWAEPTDSFDPAVSRFVDFISLKPHHCREVVGYETDGHKLALFCGATKMQDSSYCPRHHVINIRQKEVK